MIQAKTCLHLTKKIMHNVDESHRTCVVISMEDNSIQYYYSMGSDGNVYTTDIMIYLKDEWFAKNGSDLPDSEKWNILVLLTVCHSIKFSLLVVSFHVCSHNIFLVTLPFLLPRMTLIIKNEENELHFKYWMEQQLNYFYTIHCFK